LNIDHPEPSTKEAPFLFYYFNTISKLEQIFHLPLHNQVQNQFSLFQNRIRQNPER
jgi:hypothetical protein